MLVDHDAGNRVYMVRSRFDEESRRPSAKWAEFGVDRHSRRSIGQSMRSGALRLLSALAMLSRTRTRSPSRRPSAGLGECRHEDSRHLGGHRRRRHAGPSGGLWGRRAIFKIIMKIAAEIVIGAGADYVVELLRPDDEPGGPLVEVTHTDTRGQRVNVRYQVTGTDAINVRVTNGDVGLSVTENGVRVEVVPGGGGTIEIVSGDGRNAVVQPVRDPPRSMPRGLRTRTHRPEIHRASPNRHRPPPRLRRRPSPGAARTCSSPTATT